MSERVLITGGTGFIGSHIARALVDRGSDVCLFDVKPLSPVSRFVLGDAASEVRVEQGSIDNWPSVLHVVKECRPSRIVHAAVIVDPLYLAANPITAIQVNFMGTVHVLEAVRLFDVERLVNFSSIGVLPKVQYEPIDAAHPVLLPTEGPGSAFYGACKVAGESFCYAYNRMFGTEFRTIRPSAVYGLGMNWPIYIKPIVEGAVRGEPVRFQTGGRFPRDYTHVSDVANLVVAMLDAPADADRIFYGATGEPLVTTSQVAQIVRELIPGAEIEVGDDLTEGDLLELRYRGRLSIENARTQLGWEPRYRSIRDGVAEYIERYRAFLAAEG
jgi:nucleoside-diphosphate-sugar epimerase